MSAKKLTQALAFSTTLLMLTSCYAQEDKSKAASAGKPGVVATVNGVAIPQSRVDVIVKERTQQGQPDTPELRAAIKEDLVNREIIAQEATKNGVDKNAEVATQIEMAKQIILARAYLQEYVKTNPVSDDILKTEYEKIKLQVGDKEYKARHILVENEAEANSITAQLKKGGKFDAIAKSKSKDPGSASKGGELEWSTPASYVPEFGYALKKLAKGQTTQQPVKTQFGFHVIKLDDVRELKAPPFETMKEGIQQRLQQTQVDKVIGDLKAKAKIQ